MSLVRTGTKLSEASVVSALTTRPEQVALTRNETEAWRSDDLFVVKPIAEELLLVERAGDDQTASPSGLVVLVRNSPLMPPLFLDHRKSRSDDAL